MRIHTLLVLAISLCLASSASAQQSPKQDKIDKLLSLTSSDSMIDQMLNQMKSFIATQTPPGTTPEQQAHVQEMQAKMFALLRSHMDAAKLRPQMVRIYDETFSESEIDGILAFYQSPAGRALLQKMPVLMPKMMAMMQAQMADLLPEIQRMAKEAQQKP